MNNETIKCEVTGKELSSYDGQISLYPNFTGEYRVYSFYDCFFEYKDGFTVDLLIDDFITREGIGEISDYFPNIVVEIETPFQELDFDDEHQKMEFDYTESINSVFDNKFCDQADDASELFDELENSREPDIKKVFYYEFHIKTKYGKYRGPMKLNFNDIITRDDLKNAVYNMALDGYSFDEDAEDALATIPYEPQLFSGVLVKSLAYPDEADGYMDDLKYLLSNNKLEEIVELFKRFKNNNFTMDTEVWMDGKNITVESFITSLKSDSDAYKKILDNIT